MPNKMLIDATHPEETRVVVVRGNRVEEFDFETAQRKQLRGNIYLAKVTRVEPSLQAAFVEYGGNRHGFLAFSEIHPDYYQIPVADRQALIEADERAHREAEEESENRSHGRRRSRHRNSRRRSQGERVRSDIVEGLERRSSRQPVEGQALPDIEGAAHEGEHLHADAGHHGEHEGHDHDHHDHAIMSTHDHEHDDHDHARCMARATITLTIMATMAMTTSTIITTTIMPTRRPRLSQPSAPSPCTTRPLRRKHRSARRGSR